MNRITRLASVGLLALFLSGAVVAQQHLEIGNLPMIVGPGTQGFGVYRGPAIPDFFWFCDTDGTNFDTIGEVAEEVHMVQAGDLASVTFAYHVEGNGTIDAGLATALLKIYANNPTDTLVPPAGLLASYAIPDLPWDTNANHTATFDIPVPFPVGKDLWIGIEIVTPPGTAGSVIGAGPNGQSPAVNLGSSHNLTWFGPSSCTAAGGELWDNADFGFVLNYTILVRIFPPVSCDFPVPNGDFEAGSLSSWSGAGRRGVVTALDSSTVPASGAFQGFAANGAIYSGPDAPVGSAALETALGVPAGTLLALGGGAATQGGCFAQTLTVAPGDVLAFRWNFQTNEPTPTAARNDFAFLSISSSGAVVLADTFYPSFVPSPSPFAEETGYQSYAHTFTSAGAVTIGFGVADRGTTTVDSALLVDCVELIPGSPTNTAPSCTADLSIPGMDFLEVAPGAFVVTEGETLIVPFEGSDADGDLLQVSTAGFPPGATISPLSGAAPLLCTLTWTPTAADKAAAPYTLAVTYTDPAGASSTCEIGVADVNLRPECSASYQTVECTSHLGALVVLDGAASDPDDPSSSLLYQWFVSDVSVLLDDPSSPTPTGLFPIGVTMATLTVADGRGGIDVCDVLITVQDSLPPELLCTTDRATLWPPRHSMVPVMLVIAATDACNDPDEILPISVRVSSSEPDDAPGGGDGHTTGDVGGFDGYTSPVDATSLFHYDPGTGLWTGTILLRAERAGNGVGRKYTLDVEAFDSHGNAAVSSCCVVVPHDRRSCD